MKAPCPKCGHQAANAPERVGDYYICEGCVNLLRVTDGAAGLILRSTTRAEEARARKSPLFEVVLRARDAHRAEVEKAESGRAADPGHLHD